MIYGIFSGYYSDWIVEGYFNNKEDAEKWVAFKNNKSGYDEYYIKELRNIEIDEHIKNLNVKHYHKVDFIYKSWRKKFEMSYEPDGYEVVLNDKPKKIWISNSSITFNLISETREKAEKICQDLMTQIAYDFQNTKSLKESITNICKEWIIESKNIF
jgi:hypothetical protein